MRQLLRFSLLMLAIAAPIAVYAQTGTGTKAAKAPPRRPVSKPATTVTPVGKTVSKPTTANTPATGRSNSTALPNPVQTTPPPAPPKRQDPPPARPQYAPVRRVAPSSGSLGYQKGDNLLNIGVGLSSYYYGNPVGVSVEIGVDKDISVGGQFDYNSGRYDDYYGYNYRYRYSAYYLGVRGSYHFNRILRLNSSKVDLYTGLGLGYQSFNWKDRSNGSGYGYDYGSGLFLNYFIGGKYYFSDKIGAFAELGYTGLSSSRIGVSVKF